VIAREAVLNDPVVAGLLKDHFVPFAVDNVDHPNLTPGERAFLWDRGLQACTQGMTVFTAGGTVLATGGGFEPRGVEKMLRKALAAYDPGRDPPFDVAAEERSADQAAALAAAADLAAGKKAKKVKPVRTPPEGGLVLYVTWKVLWDGQRPEGSATTGNGAHDAQFQNAVGADRLWARKDEAESLARGEFPDSLRRRMLPSIDYVLAGKIKSTDLSLKDGRLAGSLTTDGGDRADALGLSSRPPAESPGSSCWFAARPSERKTAASPPPWPSSPRGPRCRPPSCSNWPIRTTTYPAPRPTTAATRIT
jgi:hypothetical protein